MVSATLVVKAITSCFTCFSISRMRSTLKAAFRRMALAAAFGIKPVFASTSAVAISTSSQRRNLFSSLQMRPIAGRVYRGINRRTSKGNQRCKRAIVNGKHQIQAVLNPMLAYLSSEDRPFQGGAGAVGTSGVAQGRVPSDAQDASTWRPRRADDRYTGGRGEPGTRT